MDQRYKKLLDIVEHGSFTKAARVTNISQPALSVAIKSLENEIGERIFELNARPLQLTAAGQLVYEVAQRMRIDLENMKSKLSRSQQLPQTIIGTIDSVALQLLQSTQFRTNTTLHVDNSSRLLHMLQLGQLDFAIVTLPPVIESSSVVIEYAFSEPFTLVANPVHETSVTRSLKNYSITEFVTYNPDSTTFKLIAAACKEQGVEINVAFRSTSPELIRQVVLHSGGAALLPTRFVQEYIERGELTAISGLTFARKIALLTLPKKQTARQKTQITAVVALLQNSSL